MKVEQYVMAYQVEQDKLRALLPKGFESLRPVLRINAEIRKVNETETIYLEFNTPVAAFEKRGWLNIAHWESSGTDISYKRSGKAVTFSFSALEITYTGVGIEGGCPAENDNDGCFFMGTQNDFVPNEKIDSNKEFCDCEFMWEFTDNDAHGISVGGKSVPAFATEAKMQYEKRELSAETAASIECEQILGSYVVCFER